MILPMETGHPHVQWWKEGTKFPPYNSLFELGRKISHRRIPENICPFCISFTIPGSFGNTSPNFLQSRVGVSQFIWPNRDSFLLSVSIAQQYQCKMEVLVSKSNKVGQTAINVGNELCLPQQRASFGVSCRCSKYKMHNMWNRWKQGVSI